MELKGKPGLINYLNYGHPKDSILELKNYLENVTVLCKKYDIPIVGGNVSLYNSTNDISIKPSPCFSYGRYYIIYLFKWIIHKIVSYKLSTIIFIL